MRGLVAAIFCGLLVWPLLAADHTFDAGIVAMEWLNDEQIFRIHALISQPPPPDTLTSHTWVITVLADRFDDGIFAWQIHVSEDHRSVVLVPNDFLTTTAFTFEQLGIQMMAYHRTSEVELWIPRGTTDLSLIAPGDEVAVHALWLQQEPLVTAVLLTQAAGSSILAEALRPEVAVDVEEPVPEGPPAPPPDLSPLPSRLIYRRGDPIDHLFGLPNPETGGLVLWAAIAASLLLPQEGAADRLMWFGNVPYDPLSETYSYTIDTAGFPAGTYELHVSSIVLPEGEVVATLVITD